MPKIFDHNKRSDLREAFLSQGLMIFGRYGLRKTSVEDLTRAVGLGKGTFYHFFSSKEEIFFEIFLRAQDRVWDEVKTLGFSIVNDKKYTPSLFLHTLLKKAFELQTNDPILRLVFDPEENRVFSRDLNREKQEIFNQKDQFWAGEIIKLSETGGIIFNVGPETLAGVIKSLYYLHLNSKVPGKGDEETFNFFVDAAINALLRS